jgi:hypothetical protein
MAVTTGTPSTVYCCALSELVLDLMQNDAEGLCICGSARCYTCSVKLSRRFEHYRTSEQSYCLVVSIYNKRRCLLKTGSLLHSCCSWYLMCDLLFTRTLSVLFDYAVTHLHTQHCWVYTMVPHESGALH